MDNSEDDETSSDLRKRSEVDDQSLDESTIRRAKESERRGEQAAINETTN